MIITLFKPAAFNLSPHVWSQVDLLEKRIMVLLGLLDNEQRQFLGVFMLILGQTVELQVHLCWFLQASGH